MILRIGIAVVLAVLAAMGHRALNPTVVGQSPPGALRAAPRADDALPSLVVDGETVDLAGEHAFDTVVVRNSGVLSVTQYAGTLANGRLTLRARRIEVDATSRITADGAGWRGRLEGKGEGRGGGEGGEVSLLRRAQSARVPTVVHPDVVAAIMHPTGSGAGGGYGGRGGDGIVVSSRGEWLGGRPYGTADGGDVEMGSAGGAPPPSHHETRSIAGGDGGGEIRLIADEVVIAGRVSADGDRGRAATFDAAGGGSGGGILIEADRLDVPGVVSAAGGRGGEAFDIAGSGGGGRIKIRYRRGSLDPAHVRAGPGKGPCPGEKASPWACEGSVTIVYAPPPAPLYLPLLLGRACLARDRRAFALVLDVSQSMAAPTRAGRPAIAAATDALRGFLDRFGPSDRAALVAFAEAAAIVQPLTDERAAVRSALDAIALGHGSRIDRGVAAGRAALAAAWPTERRVMVVVTDGVSNVDPGLLQAESAAARAAGITIYAVGIGAEVNGDGLIGLAGDVSRYLYAPDAEDLRVLYQSIAARETACIGG